MVYRMSFDGNDMFGAAILSHGGDGFFFAKDGEKFTTEEFLRMFDNRNCPYLAGKPKFFLFQACRYVSLRITLEIMHNPIICVY